MHRFIRIYTCVALLSLASLKAFAAEPAPDATIRFEGGSVAFLAGGSWGSGVLNYQGKEIPLKVGGFSVGAVGINKFDATGEVYNLKKASDIEGTYVAGAAAGTVGGGAGILEMKNSAGVVIKAHSTTSGASLKLGPSGLTIRLKN